ncbi:MAG: ABC transporter substrate-binding protein [Acidimicrobiales bacterium]
MSEVLAPASAGLRRRALLKWVSAVSAGAVLAGTLGSCGNAGRVLSENGNTAGVSAHRIVVGGIASLSGPLPADFAPVFDGVRSYLNLVNAAGGVNGRTIDFAHGLDDGSNPSQDTVQARTLVQADHVFAVVGVATPSFSGASYLAENDVPTFGYNVNSQWSNGPSLFGSNGSYLDFEHPGPEPAYLAERLGARRVGVVSYSLTQSQQACIGVTNVMRAHGIDVAFEDLSNVAPAVDLSADVSRMKRAGVDFVASCLDLAGNLVLSRTLRGAGMASVDQYWLNGYDESAVKANSSLMGGVYMLLGHVPFESGRSEPHKYPEMALYLRELGRYYPSELPSEASLAGWISAVMFVDGLKMTGRDVTRRRLVAALNSLTSYTAHGLVAPINWKAEHSSLGNIDCNVFIQVRGGHFVPVFGSRKTVFTCFAYPQPPGRKVKLAPPPPDIPGS